MLKFAAALLYLDLSRPDQMVLVSQLRSPDTYQLSGRVQPQYLELLQCLTSTSNYLRLGASCTHICFLRVREALSS